MKNIVLIGMSGVGKTQKGRYIAKILNRKFIDTDTALVEKEGLTVDDIFTKYGESYFRNIEEQLILEVAEVENVVVSAGGGIVLRANNVINLKRNGYIVYLKADVETITDNLKLSKTIRPLLKQSENLYETVNKLYMSREELYILYSDITINIENKSKVDIYNEVIKAYNEYISCGK